MTRITLTFLALAVSAGCGDDGEDPQPTDDDLGERADAGTMDARVPPPAPRFDAGPRDAASDASAADAALADASTAPKVRLSEVYDAVLNGVGVCSFCHPVLNGAIDAWDLDTTYATLVEKPTVQCDAKPLVTPGDPSKSYLVDLIALDQPCPSKPAIGRMPNGLGAIDDASIELVKRWIADGALR